MKRILLAILSVCLILASVFGYITADTGLSEVSAIGIEQNDKNSELSASVEQIKEAYEKIKAEGGGSADAKQLATGIVTDKYGSEKIAQGQAAYNAGQKKVEQGQKEYDSAKAQLEKGKAEYAAAEKLIAQKEKEIDAAEKLIAEAEPQIAAAKIQRDEAQAQLEKVKPVYEKLKPLYDKYVAGSKKDGIVITKLTIETLLSAAGYNTPEEVFSQYEAGVTQLADANQQIATAEQQLEDGKLQVTEGKKQLAEGKAELAKAKLQIEEGEAQVAAGKKELDAGKAELKSAAQQLAEGRRQMAQNSQQMASDLKNLQDLDDTQAIVDTGIDIILANEEISRKVVDHTDYDEVIAVAEDYVKEQIEAVNSELTLREQLYTLLSMLCIVCAVAGLAGLIAVIVPRGWSLVLALCLTGISAVGSTALNIYGMANDYRYLSFMISDGTGDGSLQHTVMVGLMVVAILAVIMVMICRKAYRSAVNSHMLNKGAANVKPEEKKSRQPKPEKNEKAPKQKRPADDEDEDDEGWNDAKYQKKKKSQKGKPASHTDAQKSSFSTQSIQRMQEQTRLLNEEADRLEEASRNDDYEQARRDYEAALKRFEEAKKNRSK